MRILISGSSGLVGRALIVELAKAGHTPVRLVRSASNSEGAGHAGSDSVRWDIPSNTIDAEALDGIEGVVHLAGEPIASRWWSKKQRQRILRSRVDGTTLLSEAIASMANPPSVMISGSATGFYGDRADAVIDEESSKGDGFLSDVTLAWEQGTVAAERAGIAVSHIRTGVVLSNTGGMLKKLIPLYKLALGGRLGSGNQWMSWIHLDDEVRAIMALLDSPIAGPVNLVSASPVRNVEFNSTFGRVVKRPAVIPVPAFGLRMILGSDLAEGLLLGSLRVQPSRLVESGFEFTYPDLRSALSAEINPALKQLTAEVK